MIVIFNAFLSWYRTSYSILHNHNAWFCKQGRLLYSCAAGVAVVLLCAPRAVLAYGLLHDAVFYEYAGVELDDGFDVSEALIVVLDDERPGAEVVEFEDALHVGVLVVLY